MNVLSRLEQPSEVEAPRLRDAVRVLIIDDEEDQFVLVRRLLAGFTEPRFSCSWAADGATAMAELSHGSVDVAVVDYQLGATDGVSLIRRAMAAGYDVPFILATGRGDRAIDLQAMDAGAFDFLPKADLDGAAIERSIRYAMTQHALARALARSSDELAALDEASQLLGDQGPTDEALGLILEILASRFGYPEGAVYLSRGDQLSLRASRGIPNPPRTVPASSGALVRVLREGNPLIVPAWSASRDGGPPSELVIPLSFEGRNLGILTLGIDESIGDATQQAGARELGSRLAAAIGLHRERTLIAERRLLLRRSREFAETLFRHSDQADMSEEIMAGVASAIRCSGVALVDATDPSAQVVTAATGTLRERVGRTIGGPRTVVTRVAEERRPGVDTTGMSCAVFLPLEVDDRLVGILWVERQGLEASFSDAETDTLGLIGLEAAVALVTAQVRVRAAAAGIRDQETGVYNREFLEALITSYRSLVPNADDQLGLILADTSRAGASTTEARSRLDELVAIAVRQAAGGPDVIARMGETIVGILVREHPDLRTATTAAILARPSDAGGQAAVGHATRPAAGLGSLLDGAWMALELSRRTSGAVAG